MFIEIMNASGTADIEQSARWTALSEKMDMDIISRTKSQENERGMQQEMLGILKEQIDLLRHLDDLPEKHLEA